MNLLDLQSLQSSRSPLPESFQIGPFPGTGLSESPARPAESCLSGTAPNTPEPWPAEPAEPAKRTRATLRTWLLQTLSSLV